MCGGGTWRTTRHIVLPLLRSSVISSILFISILAAGEFSVPSVLGAQGSFVPLSVHLYEAVYGFPQDYARAAAIGTMLVAVSLTAFYFYRRSVRDSRRFVTVTGRGFSTGQVDPGKWRVPILSIFGLYAFITVLLPYAALLFIVFTRFRTGDLRTTEFTLRNLETVLAAPSVKSAIVNTMSVSLVVPLGCVIIGVAIVYMHERLKLWGSGLAMYLATAPIAVSGIVFATGVLVVYVSTPVYATIWIIAIGLGAHYLAHAVRIAGNGLGQLDPSLEEAAQINGASRTRAVVSIVMPLLRPSLFAAFVLIFVFSVREVNTAILLYSPSSLLLSVLAWNYIADGTVAQAAVVGMLQTIMMVAGIVLARVLLGVRTTRNAM
jgi:iron(III) transport system permease protein